MRYLVFLAILCGALAAVKQCDPAARRPFCTLIYAPVCATKTDGTTQTYSNPCMACVYINSVSYDDAAGCDGTTVGAPATDPASPPTSSMANPVFTTCTRSNNPYVDACPEIYNPVCARLQDGTYRIFSNGCSACHNSQVTGYYPDECPPQPVVTLPQRPIQRPAIDPPRLSTPNYKMCPTGSRNKSCNRMFVATCGFKYNGLPKDYSNTCMACADESVFGYTLGTCADQVKTCPTPRLDCTVVKFPYYDSCAFEEGKAPATVSNNLCCQDSTYTQVILGVCPEYAPARPSDQTFTKCNPTNRSPVCTLIYNPVCAVLNGNIRQTFSSPCLACNRPNVIGYYPKPCPILIEPPTDPTPPPQPPTDPIPPPQQPSIDPIPPQQPQIDPIPRGRSVPRPLPPTDPIPPPVTNPNLVGFTRCNPLDRSPVCTAIYDPVCALLNGNINQTFSSSCMACNNPNVVGYYAKSCPGDQTQPPTDPTLPPRPPTDPIPPPNRPPTDPTPPPRPPIDPVPPTSGRWTLCSAGPRVKNCNNAYAATCGFKYNGLPKDYSNTCKACADESVFGYIAGDCADIMKTCPTPRLDCSQVRAPAYPSCAFETGLAPRDVSNDFCCTDTTYERVIKGQCPKTQPPAKSCANKRDPAYCTSVYKPVCGTLSSPERGQWKRTFANDCVACNNMNVRWYSDGQC